MLRKKEKNTRIYIQGLIDPSKTNGINEHEIREYLKDCGTIDSVEIPCDHISKKPKGYVLIEFRRSTEAKEAVELLNGFEIKGRKIIVQIYSEQLMRQLQQQESRAAVETINYESGSSYIHTGQARAILMQKLM
jgi:RNA-binding protein 39